MRNIVLISAGLLLAASQAQPVYAQTAPLDLVRQSVQALGGPDALRSLKTVLVKAEAKHWEPGQSYSISGESRFLGDSTLTISVDYANPIRVRFDWDRAMQYPAVDHVKYSEIRYPTYGAVVDDKGAVTPMSGIRLAASLREGATAPPRVCCSPLSMRRRAFRRSKTRSSTTGPCRRLSSPPLRPSTSCCSIPRPSCRPRCGFATKTTSGAMRITT